MQERIYLYIFLEPLEHFYVAMFGMSTLLHKRPPRSHPMGSPTVSGLLPDAQDIPGPPSAKIAAQTDV